MSGRINPELNLSQFNREQINGCIVFGPLLVDSHITPPDGCEVFVGKLPLDCNEVELYSHFNIVGRVYNVRLMVHLNALTRQFGFVKFYEVETAQRAIQILNGSLFRQIYRIVVTRSTDHRNLILFRVSLTATEDCITQWIEQDPRVSGEVLNVLPFTESFPSKSFLLQFRSHKAAAITKRNIRDGPLPSSWGPNVIVFWQPNDEVEERIRKKRECKEQRELLNALRYQLSAKDRGVFGGDSQTQPLSRSTCSQDISYLLNSLEQDMGSFAGVPNTQSLARFNPRRNMDDLNSLELGKEASENVSLTQSFARFNFSQNMELGRGLFEDVSRAQQTTLQQDVNNLLNNLELGQEVFEDVSRAQRTTPQQDVNYLLNNLELGQEVFQDVSRAQRTTPQQDVNYLELGRELFEDVAHAQRTTPHQEVNYLWNNQELGQGAFGGVPRAHPFAGTSPNQDINYLLNNLQLGLETFERISHGPPLASSTPSQDKGYLWSIPEQGAEQFEGVSREQPLPKSFF